MGFDPHESKQQQALRAVLKAEDITVGELWLHYFSIGGAVGEYEVEAYLQGLLSLPVIQRDLLAMAANELIDELPRSHAPYSEEFRDATDASATGQKEPGAGPARGSAHGHRTNSADTD
jgi:hypothetical protein